MSLYASSSLKSATQISMKPYSFRYVSDSSPFVISLIGVNRRAKMIHFGG